MSREVMIIGETLVDFAPRHRGPLRQARELEVHTGGAAANVAVGLARLGVPVGFVSVVGDDEFGHLLRSRLAQEGVDVEAMRASAEHATGLCFISVSDDGERSFHNRGGSSGSALTPDDIPAERLGTASWVHFGSDFIVEDSAFAAVERAYNTAGGVISCDPNLRLSRWRDGSILATRIGQLLAHSDVAKCSAEEAPMLTGERDPRDAARMLVERGASLAVVTLGAKGALWARQNDEGHVEAPSVSAIDTTGAGDAFMAGLIAGLSRASVPPGELARDVLERALRRACRLGSAVVTRLGATAAFPFGWPFD